MENNTEKTTEEIKIEATAVAPESAPAPTAPESPVATAAEDLIDIDHFFKMKLRVGQILEAEAVPKSKKLLKLKVDLGPVLGSRQILSGISQFYTPEELIAKRVVIVANLKPAKLMGLESQGMLLAGSTEDNSILKIVEPAADLPIGTQIS
jgi:methionyl-tRNA synthetase